MSGIRSITRRAAVAGYATDGSAPLYVSNVDNRVRLIPAGTGTTEVTLQEAGGASGMETLIAARVLTAADSGKTFFLALAAGFTVTLPLMSTAPGFYATFINAVVNTGDYVIAANAADVDLMVGSVHSAQATSADTETTAGADQFNFINTSSVIGDRFDIFTNGTLWFGTGFTALTASGTFTG